MPKTFPYKLKIAVINFKKSSLWNIQSAIKIFGASESSIYSWIKSHEQGLLLEESNIRSNYNSKITCHVKNYVKMYIEKRVTFSHKCLNRCLKNVFDIKISPSSIYGILKKSNMSYKKIGKKIVPENKDIEEQVKKLKNDVKLYDSNKIVSIDESSFDTHIRPTYGWSKKGSPIKKILNKPTRKRKTLTLAITKNEVLAYNIINNSSNALNFRNFLKESVLPKIQNGAILMDNVRFHHSKIVTECIEETTNKIIYNVPYHPESNPIEFCFSPIKKIVSNKEPSNENQLINEITKSLKTLTVSKLEAFFKHSLGI